MGVTFFSRLVVATDDVLYQILKSLRTFKALRSARLTCKAINGVYERHPRLVLLSIANNGFGPIDEAIELAKQTYKAEHSKVFESDDPVRILTSRIGFTQIVENYNLTKEFEDLFSEREKDATSLKSLLSPSESFAFRRALYRISLYSEKFKTPAAGSEEAEGDTVSQRVAYLSQFSTLELLELKRVRRFVLAMYRRSETGSTKTDEDLEHIFAVNIRIIYKAYEQEYGHAVEKMFLEGGGQIRKDSEFMSGPLDKVIQSREEEKEDSVAQSGEKGKEKIILETEFEERVCGECGQSGLVTFYDFSTALELFNFDFLASLEELDFEPHKTACESCFEGLIMQLDRILRKRSADERLFSKVPTKDGVESKDQYNDYVPNYFTTKFGSAYWKRCA